MPGLIAGRARGRAGAAAQSPATERASGAAGAALIQEQLNSAVLWLVSNRAHAYACGVTTVSEAQEMARTALAEALPRRWQHVQGVAGKAQHVADSLGLDGDVLVTAAWLHDIGYSLSIADTGFHPLDGARYLVSQGVTERVVNLVARHSNAILEAELRGLSDQVAGFPDEYGIIRDALWYSDLTTSPDGQPVSASDRIAEIKRRYGPEHIVTQFISDASPELLSTVERTEKRLAGEMVS